MCCKLRHVALILVAALVLTACSDNYRAPVKRLTTEKPQKAPVAYQQYRVQKGDTLYSISFRYGLNYKNLARNNQIPAPYRISPGQMIELNGDFVPYEEVVTPGPIRTEQPAQQKQPATVTKKPQTKPSVTKQPATKPAVKPAITSEFDRSRTVQQWYWPISTTRKYQRTAENQFVFKVPIGTEVRAVAAGRVVYSGTGLVGYGHLVIIKHSDTLLSAYAFNDRVLVKEKQTIKAGQTISTVGKNPTGEVGLGFEIRRRGKPIDARKYLPK